MGATCCPLTEPDCDRNEFYSESWPRARRPHRCCECGRSIAVGEAYHRAVGKYDGDFWHYATCGVCDEIRRHFACGGGWLFRGLWEDLGESFIPEMVAGGPCLEGLGAAAKERLFEEWRRWKGLHETDEN